MSRNIGQAAQLACTWEATAAKAGNVYPGNEFDDLGVADFMAAAVACGNVLKQAAEFSIGQLVLHSVADCRKVTRSNANLGIVLLLAPLAKAAVAIQGFRDPSVLRNELSNQLQRLTPEDGQSVYQAIRLAAAGGLGKADGQDVNETQTEIDLLAAMRQAQDRDKIAEQYSTDFRFVFDTVAPCLRDAIEVEADVLRGITRGQILLLSDHMDTLIQRKCGESTAIEAMQRARRVREAAGFDAGSSVWIEFDDWLRGDSNRRNPGTTADLIAAGLFVLLLEDSIRRSDRMY